jgi:hypothetical protein
LGLLLFGSITENLLIVEIQTHAFQIFIFAARAGCTPPPQPLKPSNAIVLRYDALSFYKQLLHRRNLEVRRNLPSQNYGPEPHQELDFKTNRLIQLDNGD